MANWTTLKAAIAQVIKTNGNKEITGLVLQNTLLSIIDNVGANGTYKGVAVPATAPGTIDGNVFYFATQKGTYVNFGNLIIDKEGVFILKNTNGWVLETVIDLKVLLDLKANVIDLQTTNNTLAQLTAKFNGITETTRNLYSAEYQNNLYQIDNTGTIGTISGSWIGTLMPVNQSTVYSIQNGLGLYGDTQVGKMAYLDSSKTKISDVDMSTLPIAGTKGKTFTTPANCAYLVFNSKVLGNDFTNSLQIELGATATDYVEHSQIKSLRIDNLETDVVNIESAISDLTDLVNDLQLELSVEGTPFTIGTLVGSTNSPLSNNITWVRDEPVTKRSKIKTVKITAFSANLTGCKIVIFDSSVTIKSIHDVTLTGLETEIADIIPVEQGEFVGLYIPSNVTTLYYTNGGSFYAWYKSGTPTVGTQFTQKFASPLLIDPIFILTPYDSIKNVVQSNETRIGILETKVGSNVVSVLDAAIAMYVGSSLTDSYYQPKSTSWIERLNDIVDIPIVNNATSGYNLTNNMTALVSNAAIKHDSGNTPKALKPSFIVWNNSANGTPAGLTGKQQLLNAKEITESMGAKMILGSEEDYSQIAKSLEDTYKSFAADWGLIYSPMIQVWRKCYPTNNPYLGFIASSHSGYRAMAPYSMHRRMLESLPIAKSVKMFKVRPSYKSGSPVITDLNFDTNAQRLRYFTAISCGATDTTGTGAIDNLDNHTYDVTGGDNTGNSVSEISLMRRGAAVTFNKYALIEFILDKIKITTASFEVQSNLTPTTVYLAITKNATQTYNDSPRTSFISIPFTYSNGLIQCAISRTDYDIQLNDKVRIIIYNSAGSFTLTYPKISNYDGIDKVNVENTNKYAYRQFGTELNPITAFPTSGHGWTLGGTSQVKAFPTEIANYTSYNAEKSHLQMQDDTATATKTISLSESCTKIAVRVVAQNFYKIATTRFIGTSIENSEYIATTPQVKTYDYDYGHLRLVVNDNIVKDAIVLQGWHELYFEIDVNPTDTQIKLSLSRNSLVDASFGNASCPILVHDISVQKIK